MRTGVRILLAVMLVGLLAGLTWAGGLFYWHYKVEKVIRYLEDGGEDCAFQPGMEATLIRAGCRALPGLVRSAGPDRPAAFLSLVTNQIVWLINRDPVLTTDDCALRTQHRKDFLVEPSDPAPVRKAKVERLQAWWAEHGREVHQWWRFWTANCRDQE
jgi:hypothetical protein